jgi:hypothetical protein
MKKSLLTIFTLLFVCSIQAQKITEYRASNGITYKIGDIIKLKKGAFDKGRFISFDTSGYISLLTTNKSNRLPAKCKGRTATIKKMENIADLENDKKIARFRVNVEGYGRVTLDIELAILHCEIENCIREKITAEKSITNKEISVINKYDQLKKLKELLDEGIITEEEFIVEKKKILAKN